jgi:hypothetical protein
MKKSRFFTLLGAGMVASTMSIMAQSNVATATVDAEVIPLVSLTKTVDMQFGKVALMGTGIGTLVLGVDGVVTPSNLYIPESGNVTPTPAEFSVAGAPGIVYTVALPTEAVNVIRTGGSEVMPVTAFTVKIGDLAAGVLSGTTGTQNSFKVGATLTVPETQPQGHYSGSFPVSISYN